MLMYKEELAPADYGTGAPMSVPSPSVKPITPSHEYKSMHPVLKDTAGLGTLLWLLGYLASMVLYFTPLAGKMGWIITAVFTPFTILVTWWWFLKREHLSLTYYAGVGVSWTVMAVVLDYFFIVRLFNATTYYAPDVFLYYALLFLIPVGVGWYLDRA